MTFGRNKMGEGASPTLFWTLSGRLCVCRVKRILPNFLEWIKTLLIPVLDIHEVTWDMCRFKKTGPLIILPHNLWILWFGTTFLMTPLLEGWWLKGLTYVEPLLPVPVLPGLSVHHSKHMEQLVQQPGPGWENWRPADKLKSFFLDMFRFHILNQNHLNWHTWAVLFVSEGEFAAIIVSYICKLI